MQEAMGEAAAVNTGMGKGSARHGAESQRDSGKLQKPGDHARILHAEGTISVIHRISALY